MFAYSEAAELERIAALEPSPRKERSCWELALRNRALAVTWAQRWSETADIDDLIQGALLGLFQAAMRWKVGRRASFATYAYWRVQHELRRVREGHMSLRVPKQARSLRRRIEELNHEESASVDVITERLRSSGVRATARSVKAAIVCGAPVIVPLSAIDDPVGGNR